MKIRQLTLTFTLLALLAGVIHTAAQGTALTYQGRLEDAAGPANGTYDFQFTVRDALADGNAVGLNPLAATLAVQNGLFTITLDPGAGVFTGDARWLEIAVRTNGAASFVTLSPRQPLTATPYAITAGGVSGSVPASQLTGVIPLAQLPGAVVTNGASGVSVSGAFSGNGAGLTNLPPNVALLGASQTFTGVNNFGQAVTVHGLLQAGNLIVLPENGVNEGGEILLKGAGANPDWRIDNNTSQVRIFSGGVVTAFVRSNEFQVLGGIVARGGPPGAGGANHNGYAFSGNGGDHGSGLFSSAPGQLEFHGNSVERMRIDSAGNVGIGTTTPTQLLTVFGGNLALRTPDNTQSQSLLFQNSGGGYTWRIHRDDAGGSLAHLRFAGGLNADSTLLPDLMTLTSQGNLGVGTTNPTAKLHLNGGIKVEGANTLEFGAGLAGKEPNAGKIGYQIFTPDALDIVGAGTNGPGRKIRFWNEGGATFAGPVAGTFTGSGAGLTGLTAANVSGVLAPAQIPNLDAGKITTGVLAPARVPDLDAGKIATGTLADGHLSANVARLDAAQTFTGANTFSQPVTINAELTARVVTITGGSDVAEPYHVAAAGDIEPIPGMVVAIDSEQIGRMRVAARAYDKTVAGILSGANGISPGITLRQTGTVADGALPVASIGRVWCYCDADANGPIEAGDMLTTSDTPGHAMKVGDFNRADGSVIGKAMSPLKSGRGLVLVLVSLK